ncbi:MAG TPA: serine/threonine-protein kinase, partial [Gaiellaceae bacterium]|nr:serine/threonine-protein kinase [Gaiellaceae bacterium]
MSDPAEPDKTLTGLSLPDRFESVRLLGRGGMGAVYLAWDRLLSRQVAIKVLAVEFADDAVARERFAREAALAGRLGAHPHIVTAYEAGEWEGRPYVAFEYLASGNLADRLQENGPLPPEKVLRWLEQAADALDYAHAAKVVHRDVKPANLLLDADDNLAVADFGVSRRVDETTLTAQGDVVGTAGYLAPEQMDGRGATAASDRFALAVVARQLLGDSAAPLGAVFDRALADDPDRRYPTAIAFVDALRGTVPARTRRRLLPPRTTPGARGVPSPARHTQRSRLWRVGVALIAVVAIAAPATAGGVVLGRRLARQQPSRPQPVVVVTRCAVSPFTADANLVVSGVGATAFCRSQAKTLSAQGNAWAFR